ncbi:hypothetical protein EYC80_003326 [Monilinia laxa]|uniref:Uncharacterized protein n=1 Tax=Monilinia laxa TaxID=61186 RepID=A0A5N6KEP7_MONLA|nr:hypothetical protein EYC80_003326 [Monilinia laxa]
MVRRKAEHVSVFLEWQNCLVCVIVQQPSCIQFAKIYMYIPMVNVAKCGLRLQTSKRPEDQKYTNNASK